MELWRHLEMILAQADGDVGLATLIEQQLIIEQLANQAGEDDVIELGRMDEDGIRAYIAIYKKGEGEGEIDVSKW